MDILPVASPPTASTNRQSGGGAADFVAATPSAPVPTVEKTADSPIADQKSPSAEHIAQAVKQVNAAFAQQGKNLYGTIDKDKISGIYVFKIMDRQTNDVIRQLPPKEIVAFARSLEQPQGWRGLLIQEKS